jgi:hypothetical protein
MSCSFGLCTRYSNGVLEVTRCLHPASSVHVCEWLKWDGNSSFYDHNEVSYETCDFFWTSRHHTEEVTSCVFFTCHFFSFCIPSSYQAAVRNCSVLVSLCSVFSFVFKALALSKFFLSPSPVNLFPLSQLVLLT